MDETVAELLASNRQHVRSVAADFDALQDSQHPDAVTVCCSDSRVLQDKLWANDEPGRLFTCATIGNRVVQRTADGDAVVAGDVLYPLAYTGTDTAVVVGHTGCGAVTATYDALRGSGKGAAAPPGVEHCLDLLAPRIRPGLDALPGGLDRAEAVDRLVERNVDAQVEALLGSENVPDRTTVVGVVYDFQDVYSDRRGEVHVINVEGETDVEALRDAHPDVADRIRRLDASVD
jgi:carbonic anhydrase